MDSQLQEKIDDFINILSSDMRLVEMKTIKELLVEDKKLLSKVEEFQLNPYNQTLKQELFKNDNFKRYKELENEIYFLTLKMNQLLNRLTDRKVCHSEDN